MDVKEAVLEAKTYVSDLFADEEIINVGLEEVDFDATAEIWAITIGFSRPWDRVRTGTALLLGRESGPPFRRSYKAVRIQKSDGKILSVRDRFLVRDR